MSSEDAASDLDTNSQSDSSTLVYDHEPFDTFKTRVLELASNVLNTATGEISIERMQGGGFNRIIGLSVASEDGASDRQYVLRIPRFEAASLNRDLAPLQLLRQQSEIHVPDVVAFDTTTRNALESPYMIQKRIPGSSLFPEYPNLPHDMKCAIAKELGKVYLEMHSIKSVTAGRLTLPPGQESLMIQPFGDTAANALVQYENGQAAKTTSELLRLLTYQKEQATAEGPNQSFRISFFDQFLATASEMNALGVLNEKSYCLCHLDLEPRNILAVTPSPNQPYAITGILDWDSAIFAPPVMSCAPPMWIWAWNDDDDEDERLADNTPFTPEFAELKSLFEEAAGPTYRRFAYGAQYRLARKLFKFALDGLQTNEDMMDAESLLSEWAQVRQSLNSANNDTAEPQLDPSIAP